MKKLDIDNSIIKSDVEKIKQEPPLKKIKTKRRLSKLLCKDKRFKNLSESAMYTKLYRLEKTGYEAGKEPADVVDAILDSLNYGLVVKAVGKEDLIKEF